MQHRNKQRKHMSVDEETFFTTVSLMYGAPDRRARDYHITMSNGFVVRGVNVYLREDPRGRVFTQCVTSFGEAKCRAGKWYWRYTQWWRKNVECHPDHPLNRDRDCGASHPVGNGD